MEQSQKHDLNHLRTFHSVAKAGSFTRAGRLLGLPKSTVSQHVRALEARLGTRLLERTTRRIALTEIGRVFFTHCEGVLAAVEEAERAAHSYSSEPCGLLRVGVPVTFAHTFLAPVLPAFCRRHPELRLELLMPGGRLDPVEHLLDVVIRIGRLADSSYIVRKLGSIPQGLYATARYLRGRPALACPADLAQHSVITTHRSPRGGVWRLTGRDGREVEARFEPRVSVADPVLTHRLAASGLGITLVPDFLARGDKNLVPVLPEWRPDPVEVFAVYPASRLRPLKLSVFLEELSTIFKVHAASVASA